MWSGGHKTYPLNIHTSTSTSVHESNGQNVWQRAAVVESNSHQKRAQLIAGNADQQRVKNWRDFWKSFLPALSAYAAGSTFNGAVHVFEACVVELSGLGADLPKKMIRNVKFPLKPLKNFSLN